MNNLNFDKLDWLIPTIIQDSLTKQVLMLWFMNKESYAKTLEDKKVWFYSRTKKRLWMKGEESWNFLNVIDIKVDCDNDTILISASPEWNTCHTWDYSCFWNEEIDITFLNTLSSIIKDRKDNSTKASYTSELFAKWENRIIQKVWEEATEVIIAAKNNDKKEIIYESADLLYHFMIMLEEKWVSLKDIMKELDKRNK